jgi:ribose 5-phosphate isomerase B
MPWRRQGPCYNSMAMKIALGSDERTNVTDAVAAELKKRGHDVSLVGPPAGGDEAWPDVAFEVGRRVAGGDVEQGVLFCWTGTGVSIAANKVPGIRAALCVDAETARGARRWNDANVLCMSLRSTSEAVASEVLDAWFDGEPEESEAENIRKVTSAEAHPGR